MYHLNPCSDSCYQKIGRKVPPSTHTHILCTIESMLRFMLSESWAEIPSFYAPLKFMLRFMLSESWAEKPPSHWGLFSDTQLALYRSTSLVPILHIHTYIPAIQISFSGYKLQQLFKILTSREVEDTGS